VNRLTPDAEKDWRAEIERVKPRIRGNIVPADMFDTVMTALEQYRTKHPAAQTE
jgi:hypothetical protein